VPFETFAQERNVLIEKSIISFLLGSF